MKVLNNGCNLLIIKGIQWLKMKMCVQISHYDVGLLYFKIKQRAGRLVSSGPRRL